jgi:(p)ppGpp synthase/HD superfamily hydrolase
MHCELVLVSTAADFAARKHSGQKRKGQAQEPYVNHLAEVAFLLAGTASAPDAGLVAAGWLHDTIEDCGVTAGELEHRFGARVAAIVLEVTDDKSLPKIERKHLQVTETPHKSPEARLLKLADKTSNLRALAASPPAKWEIARCVEYVDWAERVVLSCRDLNPALTQLFDAASAEARRAFTERTPPSA